MRHSLDYLMKIDSEGEIYSVSVIDKDFPITAKHTSLDPVLTKVFDFVMNGWPEVAKRRALL